MKIAFIVPPSNVDVESIYTEETENLWEFQARRRLWSAPDLSLLTIAGMFSAQYELKYLDLNYTQIDKIDFDLALFSPSTSQATVTYELADKLRSNGVLVAMGGVHVSVLPEEGILHADSILIGEGELIISEYIDDLETGNLKKFYRADCEPDIKLSPVPKYELIEGYPYKSIPIQTSRGCPHQCNFCLSSKLYGRKIRRKTVNQIKKEIECILQVFQNPFLFFTDDNFLIDTAFAGEMLSMLREFKLRWYAFSDAGISNNDFLLEQVYKAGCSRLLIGFESLEAKNLFGLNQSKWKYKQSDSYRKIIEKVQKYGIGVVGSFVLGLDYDTPELFAVLYQFILETRIYATNITILTPFPGTDIHRKLVEENRILTEDWRKYNGFELTYRLKNIEKTVFEQEFKVLLLKLNSVERYNGVIDYFKNIIKENRK